MNINYPKKFNISEQKTIIEFLNSINFTGYYKQINNVTICAIDQKNTYDLLHVISKCILNMVKRKKFFTIKDFFEDEYSKDILKEKTYDNGKAVLRKETHKEYDKLFGNTFEMLAYAEILTKQYNKKSRVFSVCNDSILNILSNSEYACLAFVSHFIYLLVKDDKEIFKWIDKLVSDPYNNNHKKNFKYSTINWLRKNSNRQADSSQICKKIDNYLFYIFELNKYKSNKNNKYLKQSIKDLSYFRIHVRDKNKVFLLTRKENNNSLKQKSIFTYSDVKEEVVNINKKINSSNFVHSEVMIYEPHILHSYNIHHILPKSYWPSTVENNLPIEPDMPENLIIMNQTEHYDYAHNHGDTKTLNENNLTEILQKQYEKILLCLKKNETLYDLKRFYFLLCQIYNFEVMNNNITNDDFLIRNIEDILY